MPTYRPIDNLPHQFTDTNGDPLNAGTIEAFLTGTSTPSNLYSDTGGTSLGDTVTLNSRGAPSSGGNEVQIHFDISISLDLTLKDSGGTTIDTYTVLTEGEFDSAASTKLSGIEEGADVTDATNVGAVVNGEQELFIRPQDMYLPTTAAAATAAGVESTAGQPNYYGYAFDGATAEYAEFVWGPPKRWDRSTVTAQIYWTSAATDTDGVTWNVRGVAVGNDDTIDVAYGTAVSIDDTLLGAAADQHITAESSAITIAGTPADGDAVYFRVGRDPADANDTATEDAVLLGVKIRWTSDALNDD